MLAFPAGRGELLKVVEGELPHRLARLDQQPDRDLGAGREPGPGGEPELFGLVKEPVDLGSQRAGLDLPPER